MVPSFFKKLGPISSDLVKSSISCKTINVSKNDYFDDFVSIINVSNNSLSFLYDNEKIGGDLPLNSGVICTEKMANKLNPDQKKFIVQNVQETVAKISNIFYRDYTEKEKINFKGPVFLYHGMKDVSVPFGLVAEVVLIFGVIFVPESSNVDNAVCITSNL